MKLKLVVLDLELTRVQKLVGAFVVAGLATAGALASVARADVTPFQSGQVLTANDLNANFTALDMAVNGLDGRVTTVEGDVTDLDGRVGVLEQPTVSAFKATRSIGLSVPSTTPTGIGYDIELFDKNGEYDPATGAFKPKQAGIYFIQCASFVTATQALPAILTTIIIRNNVELFAVDHQSTANTYQGQVTSTITELAANDTVNCGFFHTASAPLTVDPGGGPRAHFLAFRID
ncbi:MAG: hypothetical protein U0271_23340 [Polyangiaceae bacterium]